MLVYKYGLRDPIENKAKVGALLTKAHDYRNSLVRVECVRRAAIRRAYRTDEECGRLEQAAIDARYAVKDAIRSSRAGKARAHLSGEPSEDRKAAIRAAREVEKAALKAWWDRRKVVGKDERVRALLAEAEAVATAATKEAHAASGVHWMTTELVERACGDAFSDRGLYDGSYPDDPEETAFDGHGRVGLRFTSGGVKRPAPTTAQIMAGTADVQIVDSPTPAGKREGRRAREGQFRILRVRLRDEDGAPFWAAWPMILHRPLAEGKIAGIQIISTRDVDRIRWSATFLVDTGLPLPSTVPGEAVAVEIGWKVLDDGAILAATISDGAGYEESVVLDANGPTRQAKSGRRVGAGVIAQLQYADELRGISDRIFDQQVDALAGWVKSIGEDAPEWLRTALSTAHAWRGHRRLNELAERWAQARFAADTSVVPAVSAWMDAGDRARYGDGLSVFDALMAWTKKDHHLYTWERAQRSSGEARRRDVYRNVAIGLARRYRTVVVSDVDYSKIALSRNEDTDEKRSANKAAARNRTLVSPSSFRDTLKQTFLREGGAFEKVRRRKRDAEGASGLLAIRNDPARAEDVNREIPMKVENMWARRARQKREREAAKEAAEGPQSGTARKAVDEAAE